MLTANKLQGKLKPSVKLTCSQPYRLLGRVCPFLFVYFFFVFLVLHRDSFDMNSGSHPSAMRVDLPPCERKRRRVAVHTPPCWVSALYEGGGLAHRFDACAAWNFIPVLAMRML